MSLQLQYGIYEIQNVGDNSLWAGSATTGGDLKPGAPLIAVSSAGPKATVLLEPLGGDRYNLRSTQAPLFIGYDSELDAPSVEFLPDPSEWAIDPASGEGHYRIHVPNKDQVWTLPAAPQPKLPVTLDPSRGRSTQEWKLNRVLMD